MSYIVNGMAKKARWVLEGPDASYENAMRAALLWLANNVSDDMDDAMVASVFDAKLDMTKRDARKSALAAAIRAAAENRSE